MPRPNVPSAVASFLVLLGSCSGPDDGSHADVVALDAVDASVATDEGTGEAWSIEVFQTEWCDVPDACWRTFTVDSAGTASVEDTAGVVDLSATVDAELHGRWARFALPLEEDDCARGSVTDLAGQLRVTVVRGDRTVVVEDAWGCAGYGRAGSTDGRLAELVEDTSALARSQVACPSWDAYSPPFAPFQITEATPRFVCYP